ncbi:hypothetical protein H5410_041037 [Solanum commersonii]|uniref:Uncharacterized protein n=1 Tax=Solanum commersonii TaxID=4109 RepID=A0A9J5XQG3_SOLCO|nr:hypothetical protein H5410_041037 [Solanum commersonii]
MLRWMCGHTRRDRIRNKDSWDKVEWLPLCIRLGKRSLDVLSPSPEEMMDETGSEEEKEYPKCPFGLT